MKTERILHIEYFNTDDYSYNHRKAISLSPNQENNPYVGDGDNTLHALDTNNNSHIIPLTNIKDSWVEKKTIIKDIWGGPHEVTSRVAGEAAGGEIYHLSQEGLNNLCTGAVANAKDEWTKEREKEQKNEIKITADQLSNLAAHLGQALGLLETTAAMDNIHSIRQRIDRAVGHITKVTNDLARLNPRGAQGEK
jgi:hypothetical protein